MILVQDHGDIGSSVVSSRPVGMAFNNGDRIDHHKVDLMQPTPKDAPLDEMRQKMRETGYIFIKSLIPRDDVLNVRERSVTIASLNKHCRKLIHSHSYFSRMAEAGMLEPGSSPRDGIFNASMKPETAAGIGSISEDRLDSITQKCHEAHQAPEYLSFLEHLALRNFIKEFMQWKEDVLCTRTLLRHSVPNARSTGIHYDKIFLRKGESDFLTAWVPIGKYPGPLVRFLGLTIA
jgi:phytanoyl-CoA hydroxylase